MEGGNRGGASHILVVEDEPQARELLAAMVEGLGYEVRDVPDGQAALTAVAAEPPALILSDVEMPVLGGFDLCRRLKADPATRLIPVIMVTAIGDEYRAAGIEVGADDFLSKPVDRSDLRVRLRALLRMKSFTDALESAENVLMALAETIEARDGYTGEHCARLASVCTSVGRAMGLSADQVVALRRGGYLHDLGKVAVPDAILMKPGTLDTIERQVMERHPTVGADICRPLHTLQDVVPIIRHHHEKLDGSGYPDALRGDAIPREACVLEVVDVYDALTSDRPYRKALPKEAAFAVLDTGVAKGHWDGEIVRVLRGIVGDGEVRTVGTS